MGIVLKAYEESLDRIVALKILRPELAEDDAALTRFEREAKTAAALRHPNIVTVYAVGQEREVRFIAMEYVDGPSLAEVVRAVSFQPSAVSFEPPTCSEPGSGVAAPPSLPRASVPARLPPDLIRRIFRELLAGLDAAHKAGLIHRDIKSSNILLDVGPSEGSGFGVQSSDRTATAAGSDGCPAPGQFGFSSLCLGASVVMVKIADFGLARMRSSETQLTLPASVLGTPEYMSPEQARGEADIDERADLYSAGVVLYEMLTGRTPFRCDTPTATIHRILHEEPADPRRLDKNVDPVLASLALRLMAKLPADRFASASEVLQALQAGQRVRVPRWHRHRSLRAFAILAVLVLAVGAGWLSLRGTRTATRPPTRRITKILRSQDYKDLLAYYGNSSVPERLLWLEQLGYRGEFAPGAIVVTLHNGRQVVAIGCLYPLDASGSTLIAFDPDGRELWRVNPAPPWRWPDAPDARYWRPTAFAAGDLDGVPGDELVVVANHPGDYPTRLSVIDPETGVIRWTVWHFGQLQEGLAIVDRFFDDHRPAVVAWGQSNKLDGFEDGLRGPERQFAHWDKVRVVMVLHPDHMTGLAPPPVDPQRLAELGWPTIEPARVWAYAFLDLPVSDDEPYVPSANPRTTIPAWRDSVPDAFAVESMRVSTSPALPGARLELWMTVGATEQARVHGARFELDQNLTLLDIDEPSPGAHDKLGTNKAFWEQYWHVIMRDGEYVEER